MPLILAIEPDKRQSTQLASLVKGLQAELVQRPTAADALGALQGRVPDLVLTTSLISPRDDMALAAHLRELGPAAAHVQTVTIPLLGSAAPAPARGGMLAALRREKPQPSMTDGCAPDVFAEQVRQYLATAQEQKSQAAIRATDDFLTLAEPEPEPLDPAALEPPVFEPPVLESTTFEPTVFETAEVEPVPFEPEPLAAEPVIDVPIDEPAELAELELAAAVPEVEAFVEPAFEPVIEPVVEPEELLADEPAGLPLSQLLQLVSDSAPFAEAPVAETAVFEAPVFESPVFEAPVFEAPVFEASAVAPIAEPEPVVDAADWQEEEEIAEPVEESIAPLAADFGEPDMDPMAAQALEELSRQAPTPSIADGIPGDPPVPVVEMHAFQSLDSIASELAAGPSSRHESLDDLASLFAAPPAPPEPALFAAAGAEPIVDISAPRHGEKSLFASLFAEPAPSPTPEPFEVPGIDPSLFASAPAAAKAVEAPEPILAVEPEPEPEPVMAIEPEPEPKFEEIEEPVVSFEPVVFEPVSFEPAVAAAPAFEEEISLDVDAFSFTPAPSPAPALAPPPAKAAEASSFSFTFVDSLGDAWSDFDVPTVAAVAGDLGVGDHPPVDPSVAKPSDTATMARESLTRPPAAPALDDEALSLIGDAARKVGLDALVIEEFERGLTTPRPKKLRKKVHAGATQVPPAPAAAPKTAAKRPVQDEWGMFDPEQCGFDALENEDGSEPRPTTGTRVRVISY